MTDRRLSRTSRKSLAHNTEDATAIADVAGQFASHTTDDLAALVAAVRRGDGQLPDGEHYDQMAAVATEAIRRHTGLHLRSNQLAAAGLMAEGRVVEMATGEGKTLAALPAVLWWSLAGAGMHVVTANAYLAHRDAEMARAILGPLGISVGLVHTDDQDRDEARAAHACDVTYGTASAFGFDYLRDQLVSHTFERVCRPRFASIIDEVDQVLIDEAITPLILSGAAQDTSQLTLQCREVAAQLEPDVDYDVDEEQRTVALTDEGVGHANDLLGVDLTEVANVSFAAALRQALVAKALMRRDHEYVVRGDEAFIVDKYTGRAGLGRRWSDGLHAAVEAKEHLPIQPDSRTLATITLQDYFCGYPLLAGMSGTAMGAAKELGRVYNLDVVPVPSHRLVQRIDLDDVVYATVEEKHDAVVTTVVDAHRAQRPVLVGTPSIADSDVVSALLTEAGVPHQVLSAKHHDAEADVIAQAGKPGSVIVSTPMAGRGVDIRLGGDPPDPSDPAYATWQADAERVRDLGGLLVIGTARTASRRTDDQLRGRAGRQGDPGESRFYVSFDDELLAAHIGKRARNLVSRTLDGVTGKQVSRALERAQRTVEEMAAEQRKLTVERDEVRRHQRDVVWKERNMLLESGRDDLDALASRDIARIAARIAEQAPADVDEWWPQVLAMLDGQWSAVGPAEVDIDDDIERIVIEALHVQLEANLAGLRDASDDVYTQTVRGLMLGVLDDEWRHHNDQLDDLEDGISLRGLVGTDPEAEWRREASTLFGMLWIRVASLRLRWLCTGEITVAHEAA